MARGQTGPARATAGAQSPPEGNFDGVVRGAAFGWCWRPADPQARLEVEVLVDGESVARGLADRLRDNLARAGYGDGRYGFRVPLPEALDDGKTHRITVRVGKLPLPAAPSFIQGQRDEDGQPADEKQRWASTSFVPDGAEARPAGVPSKAARPAKKAEQKPPKSADEKPGKKPAPAAPKPARRPPPLVRRRRAQPAVVQHASVTGYIDGVIGSELAGWVVDPDHPEVPVQVVGIVDGERAGEVEASLPRDDLKRQGFGENHGFRLPLPRELTPGHHTVVVRTVRGGLRIPLAPKYVVVDKKSQPVEGVALLEAVSGTPPPAPPRARRALIGLDGWIFEFVAPDIHTVRGARPLSDQVLARNLARVRERGQLARTLDAVLIEAVVPSRLVTYSEQLPPGLTIDPAGRPVERLLAAVLEQNDLDVIDLTGALRRAKPHGAVFSRTAPGLTWLGGFAAYRILAKELAKRVPGVVPLARDQVEFGELERREDSLAELPRQVWIGTGAVPAGIAAEDEEHEGHPRLNWDRLSGEYAVIPPDLAEIAGEGAAMLRRRREPGRGIDALVIHEGSAERVAPFLAEHFDRTLLVAAGADIDRVAAHLKPAAIFEIVGEGALVRA